MPAAALQNVRAGAINRRGAMDDSERAVEANYSQVISRRAQKAVVPRKLDGRAQAYLRILENCDELVNPDRPFPSAETMLQFYAKMSIKPPAVQHNGVIHQRIRKERRRWKEERGDTPLGRGRPPGSSTEGESPRARRSHARRLLTVCVLARFGPGSRVYPVLPSVLAPPRRLASELAYMQSAVRQKRRRPRVRQFTEAQESAMAQRFDAAQGFDATQAEQLAEQGRQLEVVGRELAEKDQQIAALRRQLVDSQNDDFVRALREYRKLSVRPRRDGAQEKLVVKTHFSVTRRRAGKTPAETVKVPLLQLFSQVVAAGGLAVLGTERDQWKRVYGACVGGMAHSPLHAKRVMNTLRATFEGFEQDAAAQRWTSC